MAHETNSFKITLQENIPLNKKDLEHIRKSRQELKIAIVIVLALVTIVILSIYYDEIFYKGLFMCGVFYLVSFIIIIYQITNWKKDIAKGKSQLTGVLIYKSSYRFNSSFTFEGEISIQVTYQDYQQYQIGDKLIVEYLPSSKTALRIAYIA